MCSVVKDFDVPKARAFIRSFVKEIQISPGNASIIYTIPMPEDSPPGA